MRGVLKSYQFEKDLSFWGKGEERLELFEKTEEERLELFWEKRRRKIGAFWENDEMVVAEHEGAKAIGAFVISTLYSLDCFRNG